MDSEVEAKFSDFKSKIPYIFFYHSQFFAFVWASGLIFIKILSKNIFEPQKCKKKWKYLILVIWNKLYFLDGFQPKWPLWIRGSNMFPPHCVDRCIRHVWSRQLHNSWTLTDEKTLSSGREIFFSCNKSVHFWFVVLTPDRLLCCMPSNHLHHCTLIHNYIAAWTKNEAISKFSLCILIDWIFPVLKIMYFVWSRQQIHI